MGQVYGQQLPLYRNGPLLKRCIEIAGITTTRATWKSPCLVLVKLAMPDLDTKTASQRARALNYCAAAGLTAEQTRDAVRKHGVVDLAKREARRQKARKGDTGVQTHNDVVAAFVGKRRAIDIEEVDLGDREVALLIVGRNGDQNVVYDLDDNDRRMMEALRGALKRDRPLIGRLQDTDKDDDADAEPVSEDG
jgi:hypothetical protein